MHDNAPSHSSNKTKQFLKDNGISVLEHPSKSPDLNPIELVWAKMKNVTSKRVFNNCDEMEVGLRNVWEKITITEINNIIDHHCNKLKKVLENNGSYTK